MANIKRISLTTSSYQLPLDVILMILEELNWTTLSYSIPLVCKSFYELVNDHPTLKLECALFRDTPRTRASLHKQRVNLHPILTALVGETVVNITETKKEVDFYNGRWVIHNKPPLIPRTVHRVTPFQLVNAMAQWHEWAFYRLSQAKRIRSERHRRRPGLQRYPSLGSSTFAQQNAASPPTTCLNIRFPNLSTKVRTPQHWAASELLRDLKPLKLGHPLDEKAITVQCLMDTIMDRLNLCNLRGHFTFQVTTMEASDEGDNGVVPTLILTLEEEGWWDRRRIHEQPFDELLQGCPSEVQAPPGPGSLRSSVQMCDSYELQCSLVFAEGVGG